jgi:6-phospho-3-hexuloisomerase
MHADLEFEKILSEINSTLRSSNFGDLDNFVNKIINAEKIVVFGAGRVGLMMKTFAMRLTHLKLNSFFIGEVNLPKTGSSDLLIIGSGSGNTKSVVTIAEVAKSSGLDIISITSNLNSLIANLSSSLVHLNCETKNSTSSERISIQPMTTLFEQSLLIFLDSLVLILMKKLNEDHKSMLDRHNVIE